MSDRTISLTAADQGRTIDLRVGAAVAVTLDENATTGYRWAIDHADTNLVTIRDPTAAYPGGAIGSGGTVTWSFVAKAPGTTIVSLKQWRQWEGDRSIIGRFQVTFSITA